MTRAILLVLDSVGIGGAPDAERYGDVGANTVGHIAEACANGRCDIAGIRAGPLDVPTLARLGLGKACELATGCTPHSLAAAEIVGRYGCAAEISHGKDTPSGHWELLGVPVILMFSHGCVPGSLGPLRFTAVTEALATHIGMAAEPDSAHLQQASQMAP